MPSRKKSSLQVVKDLSTLKKNIFSEIGKVIVGQEETLHLLLSSLFSGGHSLLIGVPGLAKTLIVSSLAQVLDISFNRIQFTPDLMPSDITGSDIIEEIGKNKQFRFINGPVFSNIVLADEINRTPPKTQAALLQAMQELQVTVSGKTYDLHPPFFVLATQNPIEQEGTYPLPEAQLDRFMYSINVPYPEAHDELQIVTRSSSQKQNIKLKKKTTRKEILDFQHFVKFDFPAADTIIEATVNLVRETRPAESSNTMVRQYVGWGAGPRAGTFLLLGAKSIAALSGKKAVDLDDIKRVAYHVLRHRILLNYEAEAEGIRPDDIISELLSDLRI